MTLYRLDVQVGGRWIPAIKEPVSEERAKQLKSSYAVARPSAKVRIVPVDDGHSALAAPQQRKRSTRHNPRRK